tara:strand:+ start:6225 stop:6563 length:339 start_codon:yes stop_codon:yes gene_type:complete
MNADVNDVGNEIFIAKQFSRTPGGRYYTDGPSTGEQFREEILIPALKKNKHITIHLDGARGYPSSFLEEAFGGAVRRLGISPKEFFERVRFVAGPDFQIYVDDITFHVNRVS